MKKKTLDSSNNKKYIWSMLYIVFIIIGQQLAGIAGILSGAFIAFGIYRTFRNPDLSNTKKWIYSILYTFGGIIIGLIIVIIIASLFSITVGPNYLANLNSEKNIEENYLIEPGFKTFESKNLEISALSYPSDWIVSEDNQNYQAVFQSPNGITSFLLTLYRLPEGKFDINTYLDYIEKEDLADDSYSFVKSKEEIKKINGKDWLVFEGVITFGEGSTYEKIAYVPTGKYSGSQYIEIIMVTNQENFATESATLDKVLESIRFYS